MIRLRQAGIVAVGLVLAAAMAVLGVWQLDVYTSQGNSNAAAKAAAPPLALTAVATPGAAVREGFGRSVRFEGRYDPSLQLLVGGGGGPYRVLSGLVQADGSVVPVVRGVVDTLETAPDPPTGPVDEVGVLLPSEDDAPAGIASELSMDAVRLPVLAQRWTGPLIGGYVTLSTEDSRAQGMSPAPLVLPEAKGRMRNAAYAFQWWLFGAFAVAMAVRMARDAGRREDTSRDGLADGLVDPETGLDTSGAPKNAT